MNMLLDLNWKFFGILSFLSLVHSLPSEEREALYREHNCTEKECDIAEITFLRLRKRSTEEKKPTVSFLLKAFETEKIINLRPSSYVLVGPNTPVYYAISTPSSISIEKKLGLFSSTYQVYEDKTNLATFTIDTNSTEIKIESGFLGHENVIITKLLNAEGSGNQYLAKTIPNDAFDALKNYLNISLPVGNHSNKSIPEEIFPEILVIVDYELFLILQARLFSYLLQFWNGVNLYFSTLEKPQYHLSIAGVIIPLDDQVLDFMNPTTSVNTNQQLVNYELVLFNMDSWLKVVSRLISFDSYDTYILMTPHRDGIFEESTTAGLSALGSSCSGVLYNEPHGGIIYDKGNYHGILTGAHELGHLFGANHDNGSCAIDSVMAEKESPSKKTWSECSKKQFLDALQIENFSCMYNKPNFENSSLPNDLEESVPDSEVLAITPNMFNPDKLIVVSHKKSFIKVRQIDRNFDDEEVEFNDLHVSIPRTTSLIFDPRMIEFTKMIIINYINKKIYINTVDL
ncbi:uncharacterized protein LOC141533763 [Cotesia typhae]|uniref:uncharacterized protein LOC141533763 n=1 Tax=Cotesia typhae TaxID=2053667 RepID=UPI003D687425